jgi:hypothetical protein
MASANPTMDCFVKATMSSASARIIMVFLVLTFALSVIFYYEIIASGSIQGSSYNLCEMKKVHTTGYQPAILTATFLVCSRD